MGEVGTRGHADGIGDSEAKHDSGGGLGSVRSRAGV